ncbi:ankyrin repeat protein [Moumouvirus australiensis]|uniref:Ankyrin repeat protein n=1 Tax=Moumouvirus australiensis TaxID=2109587 RepID=A0A2P1EMD6_9VIRU|nr:ankyrin repeat protein [Moumouvirus australiensis]AVL95018.1 ankyrin repeat protein [Moumouvirus australiensis]
MNNYIDSFEFCDISYENLKVEIRRKYKDDINKQIKNLQLKDKFEDLDEPTQKLYLKYLVNKEKLSDLYKILKTYDDIFFEDGILFYAILYISQYKTVKNYKNFKYIYDLVKLFIDKGFDVTLNNHLAIKIASKSSLNILELVIANGGDITTDNNFCMRNLSDDTYERFLFLIKNGADPFVNNCVVLKQACGNIDIIKYFIENGVDINLDKGFILRKNLYNEYFEIVKFLLEYGADINFLNNFDIFLVIQSRNIKILKLLVDAGVDLSQINSFCETKINKSESSKQFKNLFSFLVNEGIDPFNVIHIFDSEKV